MMLGSSLSLLLIAKLLTGHLLLKLLGFINLGRDIYRVEAGNST